MTALPTGALRKRSTAKSAYGRGQGRWTPHDAAKAYARAYPDKSGLIEVVSHQPKGRGGRCGLGTKRTLFVVIRGEAMPLRDFRAEGTFNGRCRCCGRLHLGGALRWAYDAEGRYVPGACERCIGNEQLSIVRPAIVKGHSPLMRHDNALCARLDIRAVQFDHSQKMAVEELAEAGEA